MHRSTKKVVEKASDMGTQPFHELWPEDDPMLAQV